MQEITLKLLSFLKRDFTLIKKSNYKNKNFSHVFLGQFQNLTTRLNVVVHSAD